MNPRDLPAMRTTVIGIDARAALPSSAASHWCGLGRAFIAVCLSMLVLAVGCSPEKPVEELLQDAQRYRANREFAAAAIVLQNVLKRSPLDPDLYFELGRVRLEAGDLPGAEIALRKALELGTPQAQILPLLGTTLLQMERFQVVLDDVNPAPGLDPGVLADVSVARARAYLGLGNFVDARTAFLSAMAERPAEALLGIAHLALGEGEIAAAEKLLEDLAAKHPAHADLWVTQGNLLRIQRKSAEALKAYQRGAKEEPHNAAPYLSMALLHASEGEFDRASAMLEQARQLRPWGPSLEFARAFVAFRQGKRQESEEALRRVVRVIPDHLPARLLSAMLHHSRGALETARVEYLKYLRTRPTDLNARKLLTRLLLQQAQPQSALNVILPVLEFVPDDPDLPALVGDAYMQLGELEQAAQQFERAAKLGPQDARLRARLGASRFALGQSEAAVADFRTALELKPGDVQSASLLVKALIARKELDPALEAANALEKKHPRNPLALATKATVLLARRDVPGARAQYQRALDVDPKYFPAAVVLARLDLRDQRPEAAQKRFESILKKDRNNLDATLALASLHLQLNRVDDALRVLHDAQVVHPDSAAVRLQLVQALLGARKLGAALETARKARELAPNDPRAMEMLAEAQIASADYAAAAVTLAELVSTTPRSIAAKLKLAAALRANGEGARAVGVLQKAVEQDPTRLDAMLALTTEYVREKRFAEALEMAARIRKQKPDAVETFVLEGDVLRQQGKLAAAESAYRRAHALRSTGSTLVKLHETLRLIAGRPVSDLSLVEWLSKRPDDVEVRLYLGWIYLEKRDWRAAADHYREVLKRYPDMPMALNNLALALQHLGDAQALAFARRAHQLRPNDGAVLDTLGLVLLGQGHPDEALERLQNAVSMAPEAPEIRYHLAMALLLHGDKAAAKRELEAAVASKKPFSERAEAEARLKELRR